MLIKFLKDYKDYKKGDITAVTPSAVRSLVQKGVVEKTVINLNTLRDDKENAKKVSKVKSKK